MPRVPLTREQCHMTLHALQAYLVDHAGRVPDFKPILMRLETGMSGRTKPCRFCRNEMELATSAIPDAPAAHSEVPSELMRRRSAWVCIADPYGHVEMLDD